MASIPRGIRYRRYLAYWWTRQEAPYLQRFRSRPVIAEELDRGLPYFSAGDSENLVCGPRAQALLETQNLLLRLPVDRLRGLADPFPPFGPSDLYGDFVSHETDSLYRQ